MDEKQYTIILNEIEKFKKEFIIQLENLENKIRYEMSLKDQALDFKQTEHDRRLSFTEKILFSTAGFLLLSVLGAIVALVLK